MSLRAEVALLFVIAVVWATWFGFSLKEHDVIVHRPKHAVRTCLREANAELWDHTYRIEMVGKENYLARVIPYPLHKPQNGFSLSFEHGNTMLAVECPTK